MSSRMKTMERRHSHLELAADGLESFTQSCSDLPLDLGAVFKMGLVLWTLVGISTAFDYFIVGKRPAERSHFASVQGPGLFARLKQEKTWNNPNFSEGEMGAMKDSNMKRLNEGVDIQQLVNNAPAGYDRPYRSQSY